MPRLIYTENAGRNIQRIADFWRDTPEVGKKAVTTILQNMKKLEQFPNMGKPFVEDDGRTRILFIPFGASSYVARYQFNVSQDSVRILSIRHAREAGFTED